MKKSRIAKFALLGASAAALAATLSTSTYAWYVSSRQADVTGGTGQTGTVGSDGSVLVSWDNAKWLRTITFTDTQATNHHNASTAALQPVHYSATDKTSAPAPAFYKLSATGTQGEACAANDVLTFSFYIKADLEDGYKTTITPSITFKNYGADSTRTNATTPAKQLALLPNGLPTGATLNSEFCVNAMDSTYVQQSVNGTLSYCAATATTNPTGTVTGGNAHQYWNAVTGATMSWGTTTNSAEVDSTSLAAFDLSLKGSTDNTKVLLTYTIFLDGGDTDCFNSAAGQYFSFDLTLNASNPTQIS